MKASVYQDFFKKINLLFSKPKLSSPYILSTYVYKYELSFELSINTNGFWEDNFYTKYFVNRDTKCIEKQRYDNIESMKKFCEKHMTIYNIKSDNYKISINPGFLGGITLIIDLSNEDAENFILNNGGLTLKIAAKQFVKKLNTSTIQKLEENCEKYRLINNKLKEIERI